MGVGVWEDLFELHTLQDREGQVMSELCSARGMVAVLQGICSCWCMQHSCIRCSGRLTRMKEGHIGMPGAMQV